MMYAEIRYRRFATTVTRDGIVPRVRDPGRAGVWESDRVASRTRGEACRHAVVRGADDGHRRVRIATNRYVGGRSSGRQSRGPSGEAANRFQGAVERHKTIVQGPACYWHEHFPIEG